MDIKKIIPILIIICVIIVGALIYTNQSPTETTNTTQTNITLNQTNNTTAPEENITYAEESAPVSSYSQSSSSVSEPEYGSDEYVKKWDQSQASDGDWAYTHDQPVMTDDDGNRYARIYSEDTGESSWRSMESPATSDEEE